MTASPSLPPWGAVLGASLMGGIVAAVVNGLIWLVLGQDVQVPKGAGDEMTDLVLPMVIVACVVPSLVAGVIAKLAVRSAARASLVLGIMGVGGFLFSLGGPLTIKDAPGGDVAVLVAMHLVAVVAIIGSLLRRYRAA